MMMYNIKQNTFIASVICLLFILLPERSLAGDYDRTADGYSLEIKRLYQDNRLDSVKIMLDEALRLYPNDSELNRWSGSYFLKINERDNARYFLIKSVQLDADNFQAKNQLVNLEEELGNISSAICYVNEMLELYPYDAALWKKKIGLYRKQGNDIEADRLLKRLITIYPNDSLVHRDYLNRMEEIYLEQRRGGDLDGAMETLGGIMKYRHEKSYYLDMSNMMLKEGHSEEAVATLAEGLERFPSDQDLLRKKAEIMAERGNDMEAVRLLGKSGSPLLVRTSEDMMAEAAAKEGWKDPYSLYGRIYDSKKSPEALDYLLRTSISRGYDDDALFYLSEYRKIYGNSSDILYREYRIYRRTGNDRQAMRVLEKYVELNPYDYDMAYELALMKLDRADMNIRNGMFEDAIPDLKTVMLLAGDGELQIPVAGKLVDCYIKTNRNSTAVSFIDSLRISKSDMFLFVTHKARALHKSGSSHEALEEIERLVISDVEAYEQISSEYLKRLLDDGAAYEAHNVSRNWVRNIPESKDGLMAAIRTSENLSLYDEADGYISAGRNLYPEDPFFVIKEAASMYRNQEYKSAVGMLAPWLSKYPGNRDLVLSNSANAEMWASELLKEKKADEALSVTGKAISLDEDNRALLYVRGRAFEMRGDYDSAYVSYSKYIPKLSDMSEHRQKLMYVRRKGYKNMISADVFTGWYSDGEHMNTIISAAYSRKMKRDYITATLNLSSRDTETSESEISDIDNIGTGAQFRVDWGHTFGKRWTTVAGFAVANRFFPSWLGQVGVFHMFPKDVELGVSAGYRKNYVAGSVNAGSYSGDMYNVRVSGNLYRDYWTLNTNCDGLFLNGKPYFNLNTQFKYYTRYDSNTHIAAYAGVGTAPEMEFADRFMPGSFENINVSFGIGGQYMVSKNVSLGITATSHWFCNQKKGNNAGTGVDEIKTNYRNLYDIYAQVIFCF